MVGKHTAKKYMELFWKYINLPKPLLLPIVARSAFEDDFKDTLNPAQLKYYYPQQCAMKYMFGVKATIKFID